MNRDRLLTAAVVAAVAVGLVVTVRPDDLGERPADTRVHRRGESKLVELADGGRGYAYPTTLDDGGTEYVITETAPCVRAREDAGLCWRLDTDGGARFFGWDNRFPREDMHPSSTACQPVACSVVAGDDAEEDEDAHLARERAQRGGR